MKHVCMRLVEAVDHEGLGKFNKSAKLYYVAFHCKRRSSQLVDE